MRASKANELGKSRRKKTACKQTAFKKGAGITLLRPFQG
jgi:hypothetical protein